MLDLRRIVNTHSETVRRVDLGNGISCLEQHGQVSYYLGEEGIATAFLGSDLSPRVTFAPAVEIQPHEALLRMMVINLASSRANQMSFAANLQRERRETIGRPEPAWAGDKELERAASSDIDR